MYSAIHYAYLYRQLIMSYGGRFTISDDSHGIEQVGLNYERVLTYIESLGLGELHYLERLPMGQLAINCLGPCKVRSISVVELRNEPFYLQLRALGEQ